MALFGSNKSKRAGSATPLRELLRREHAKHSNEAVCLVDKETLVAEEISPSFLAVTGVSPERLHDDINTLTLYMSQDDRRAVAAAVEGRDPSQPCTFEFTLTRPDNGKDVPIRSVIAPTEDPSYDFVLLEDISAERATVARYEEELSGVEEEAQVKIGFLNKMSHEIRTPLNGIIGMLAIARADLTNTEKLESVLGKAAESGSYLLSLVNDILDMSRLESGKTELVLEPFSLDVLANKIAVMFEQSAEVKGLRFSVDASAVEDRYLVGDKMRIQQIVINFVSNAIKFTSEGGEVAVTFREMFRSENNAHILIKVHDTGKGIEREYLSKIFLPFSQENASISKKYGGTGLGMPIANQLARLMGSEVIVDSEPGRGSDFSVYLTLPIADEASIGRLAAEAETVAAVPVKADYEVLRGTTMLVAEDNEVNAMIVEEMLKSHGVNMLRAHDGGEVVEQMARSKPGSIDAILMDIQMPVHDGWEATKIVRALDHPDAKSIIILALSANAYAEDKRKSVSVGMDDHISKPVDFDELVKAYQKAKALRG